MVGEEKPVYLEYDLPDADFIKQKEEDSDVNTSDEEMSICSIQSIDSTIKDKLTNANMIGRNSMFTEYMIQESEPESTDSETNTSQTGSIHRISKLDAQIFERVTKKSYEGDLASSADEIETSDSSSDITTSSFSIENMDAPTLNLLTRFRSQVVSEVKSKLKDESTSDSETGSDTETGSETETETDSYSIAEPKPDIAGPRPSAILRRKSMVPPSGLRRRNNAVVPRRRSDMAVTFADSAHAKDSHDESGDSDASEGTKRKHPPTQGRKKSVVFNLSKGANQGANKPLTRRQSILKSGTELSPSKEQKSNREKY